MLHSTPQDLSTLLWVAVCGYALWKGSAATRIVAAALLLNLVEMALLRPLDRPYHVHLSLVVGDVMVLAAALFATRRSGRAWLSCVIAFQLLSLATHAAKGLDPTLGGWAYVTLAAFWGYGVLACLLVGVRVETSR